MQFLSKLCRLKHQRLVLLHQFSCAGPLENLSSRTTALGVRLNGQSAASFYTNTFNKKYYANELPYRPNEQRDTDGIRTTFASLKPVDVDASAILKLFQAEELKVTSQHATNSGMTHRLSDDFLYNNFLKHSTFEQASQPLNPYNTFPVTDLGKRSYSTDANANQSKENGKQKESSDKNEGKSKMAELRRVFAVYGTFGMAFHIVISLASLGLCYLLLSSGIDIVSLLSKMGLDLSGIAAGASTMVMAYAVHKLLLPVRASITIVSVPICVRYLRKLGYLKK